MAENAVLQVQGMLTLRSVKLFYIQGAITVTDVVGSFFSCVCTFAWLFINLFVGHLDILILISFEVDKYRDCDDLLI